jgi:hypothetical protein
MAAWQMTIHGGFAWVFTNNDASVTIGPFRKPQNVSDHHPHEMILRIPEQAMVAEETSLPFRRDHEDVLWVLRGDVRLLVDGRPENASGLQRVNTGVAGDSWNHFDYVYNANKLKEPGEPNGRLVDDWRGLLLTCLEIRDGEREVRPPAFTTKYDLINGHRKRQQVLATHLRYKPRSTPNRVAFETPHGRVVARPAEYFLAADCGCVHDPVPGKPIEGFAVTFNMYRAPNDHLKYVPHFRGANSPAAVSPGPDCPPREFNI